MPCTKIHNTQEWNNRIRLSDLVMSLDWCLKRKHYKKSSYPCAKKTKEMQKPKINNAPENSNRVVMAKERITEIVFAFLTLIDGIKVPCMHPWKRTPRIAAVT